LTHAMYNTYSGDRLLYLILVQMKSMQEGKNRQIRKMVGAFSHAVEHLRRVRFGSVTLQGLHEGGAELLSEEVVLALLESREEEEGGEA
jgi:16S rRNA U516 pseudouridylate synthase RsuA-like enzyme